ncbi:MAG: hypothetical protein Q7R44_00140 [bacterium]|nr:hypothetical protein [bacterium]
MKQQTKNNIEQELEIIKAWLVTIMGLILGVALFMGFAFGKILEKLT